MHHIDVLERGIVADGKTDMTESLQRLINENGIEETTLYFGEGTYLCSTLFLRSNLTLQLGAGARLLAIPGTKSYPTVRGSMENNKPVLLFAEGARNLALRGVGTVDGNGDLNAHEPRLVLARLIDCIGLTIEGVTLYNAGMWCVHMVCCEDIHLTDMTLINDRHANGDGFDFDSCRRIFIRGCFLRSNDDSICFKSTFPDRIGGDCTISDCVISSDTAAMKIGTSSVGNFRNLVMRGCVLRDCPMGVLKIIATDGGAVENILLTDLVMDNVGSPLFIRVGRRNYDYTSHQEMDYTGMGEIRENGRLSAVRHVMLSRIIARVTTTDTARNALFVTGLHDSPVEDLSLSDIRITVPGGGSAEDAAHEIAEDEARYPEQYFFGPSPAYGMFLRHIRDLCIRDTVIRAAAEDARQQVILQDVTEL